MGDKRFEQFVGDLRVLCGEYRPSVGEITRAVSIVMNGGKRERGKRSTKSDAKLHEGASG